MWSEAPWSVLIDAAMKASVLLVAGWVGADVLMRRSSAAWRHLVWTGVLMACLVLPGLSGLLPQWRVLPAWGADQGSEARVAAVEPMGTVPDATASPQGVGQVTQVATPAAAESRAPAQAAWWSGVSWRQWALVAWAAGAVACLLPIVIGRLAVARICREARAFYGEDGADGMVVVSARCRMPMACGITRRRVVLPQEAEWWPAGRTRAVVEHERAHVRRRDCLWQLLGQLARALYWFNPLVWMAYRQLLCESEKACDDAVLTRGSQASAYAEHLMAIATAGRSDSILAAAAIAMARPRTLEGRLMAVLDGARNRRGVTRAAAMVMVALLVGVAIPLAAVRAQSPDAPKVRVVYGSGDVVLLDGKPTTWEQLPAKVAALPDREKLFLEMADVSDEMPVSEFRQAQTRLSRVVEKNHLKYLSDTGKATAQEIAALTGATSGPAARPTEAGKEALELTLAADPGLAKAPMVKVKEGSRPVVRWRVAEGMAKPDYQGIIVVPAEGRDLWNIESHRFWEMLNVVKQHSWSVMGLPSEVQAATYGQEWPGVKGLVEWHPAEPLKTGYYMVMVLGYAGEFRASEDRQATVSAAGVLQVGNPPTPATVDTSKLTPEQMTPKLKKWVEGFFKGNYRDITARKTLEWGEAKKLPDGNWSIRYKYEATIWGKDKLIQDKVFTFTPEGGFVSVANATEGGVPAVPHP